MKLLLAAATEAEIAPVLSRLQSERARFDMAVCITGVGIPASVFSLTERLCSSRYDFVLQAGIAGSFDRALPLGSLAVVGRERFGDLGAEDGDRFLDLFQLGFAEQTPGLYQEEALVNGLDNLPFDIRALPVADAITVSTVAGTDATATARAARFGFGLESMEGAALHYVCLKMGIPFLQLRAVSNYAERRNRASWQIGPAIGALNTQLAAWLF